uniref:Uncharacterized protein n=1 Tax=Oryza barthii TaxID=65489 RepID=A0A0D3GME4_9ORYZ
MRPTTEKAQHTQPISPAPLRSVEVPFPSPPQLVRTGGATSAAAALFTATWAAAAEEANRVSNQGAAAMAMATAALARAMRGGSGAGAGLAAGELLEGSRYRGFLPPRYGRVSWLLKRRWEVRQDLAEMNGRINMVEFELKREVQLMKFAVEKQRAMARVEMMEAEANRMQFRFRLMCGLVWGGSLVYIASHSSALGLVQAFAPNSSFEPVESHLVRLRRGLRWQRLQMPEDAAAADMDAGSTAEVDRRRRPWWRWRVSELRASNKKRFFRMNWNAK